MKDDTKMYKAMIWTKDPTRPGERVTVRAKSLAEAKRLLEEQYGAENVYSLHNEEEASRPR